MQLHFWTVDEIQRIQLNIPFFTLYFSLMSHWKSAQFCRGLIDRVNWHSYKLSYFIAGAGYTFYALIFQFFFSFILLLFYLPFNLILVYTPCVFLFIWFNLKKKKCYSFFISLSLSLFYGLCYYIIACSSVCYCRSQNYLEHCSCNMSSTIHVCRDRSTIV